MTIALNLVVKREVLGLDKSFQGPCFSNVFFKTCQCVIINEKSLQEYQVCFNQIYPIKFVEMYNLA
jgi:hypothetical protein